MVVVGVALVLVQLLTPTPTHTLQIMAKRLVLMFSVLLLFLVISCVCVWEHKCWSLPSPCFRQALPIVCTWLLACELSGILLALLLTVGAGVQT